MPRGQGDKQMADVLLAVVYIPSEIKKGEIATAFAYWKNGEKYRADDHLIYDRQVPVPGHWDEGKYTPESYRIEQQWGVVRFSYELTKEEMEASLNESYVKQINAHTNNSGSARRYTL